MERNNRGSAMVMVLTIISLIAILGIISMTTALTNVKMRGINRNSDKNFYYLETALDEIHAQLGRTSSEILKEEYAAILGRLYETSADTNEKANEALKKAFIDNMKSELNIEPPASDEMKKSNREKAALHFKQYATTFVSDPVKAANFNVTIGEVVFEQEKSESRAIGDVYNGLVFKDVCLTYINPDTDAESALTVDLNINIPYVKFISGGDTLFDYIMVSNKGISATSIGETSVKSTWNGNVYGGLITVDHTEVDANSSLMTAAGNLTIKNNGIMKIGPDLETGGGSRVWSDGVELSMGSELTSSNSSFFVRDDLTLLNNNNKVKLEGSYYGYGNEGVEPDDTVKWDANKSSAILLNDKNSRVDLEGLDSLMLAGKAYLRFNSGAADYSQHIYPMGESLAVRATQAMYLVPEKYITVQMMDGSYTAAGANPVVIPTDADKTSIKVEIPKLDGVQSYVYEVSRTQAGGTTAFTVNNGGDGSPAFLVALNGKIYVYYNFASDKERSAYFENYLKTNGSSFEALLKKSNVTGENNAGGVFIKEDGQLLTSGSLYQVSGSDTAGAPLFELLRVRNENVSNSLRWVEFGENLFKSFENLKSNLAETVKVSGNRETVSGGSSLLPMGNYVKISKLNDLSGIKYISRDEGCVLLSKNTLEIEMNGKKATVAGSRILEHGGLIVTAGDVKITGTGEFNGLIIAGGNITINGNVTLTADAGTYESLLGDEEVAGYFYDYSDAASTVLNRYEDFVTTKNWSRTGREQGGTD